MRSRSSFLCLLSPFVAAALLIPSTRQGESPTGRWQIVFESAEELFLTLTADRPMFDTAEDLSSSEMGARGLSEGYRPVLAVHCKAGRSRVFLEPALRTYFLQFSGEQPFRARFVELVRRGAEEPPLEALADADEMVRTMLRHDTLELIDRRAYGGRTTFSLDKLGVIVEALGDPCGWLR